jgi:hypothetical protein
MSSQSCVCVSMQYAKPRIEDSETTHRAGRRKVKDLLTSTPNLESDPVPTLFRLCACKVSLIRYIPAL